MCIRIVRDRDSLKFDMSKPLERQIEGAREIVVNYDPANPKIESFVSGLERMVRSGVGCLAQIRVNANSSSNGLRLERKLESLQKKLLINETVKSLTKFQSDTDNKLCEISRICLGSDNG